MIDRLTVKTWLIVFASLLVAAIVLPVFMMATDLDAAGRVLNTVLQLVLAGWIVTGLLRWRAHPVVRKATGIVVGTVIAALVVLFAVRYQMPGAATVAAGVYVMAICFYLGVQLVRLLLTPGWAVFGVARTLIDEAMRMKVPLVFLVLLLLFVPMLPFLIDPTDFLKYRIQSFLTWSMMAVSTLLGLMTIFLSVGTVTSELEHRQIFLTMAKPVSRGQYLVGKWLGVSLLNLLLIAVCGGAIYLFTMTLAKQPARDGADAAAVEHQILVARAAQQAEPPSADDLAIRVRERLAALRQQDPQTYGRDGDPVDPAVIDQLQDTVLKQWYSVAPRNSQTYRFTGLSRARQTGQQLQFRFKPRVSGSSDDAMVAMAFRVNGHNFPVPGLGYRPRFADDNYHVFNIPAEAITADGYIDLQIGNPVLAGGQVQNTITFNTKDGLEVFYRVGTFEGNLVRSLALLWLRLVFLAMLGIAAGTFLGFPVACLICLMIYAAAAGSHYLGESLRYYATLPKDSLPWFERIVGTPLLILQKFSEGEVLEGLKIIIRVIGTGFMFMVPSFGDFNPTPLLSDGRAISTRMLLDGVLKIGVVWTGAVGLIGYLVFRTRELARVTV